MLVLLWHLGGVSELVWVVQTEADMVDWTVARSNAAFRTDLGMTGYLATITSAQEESFILCLNELGFRLFVLVGRSG